MKLKIKKLLSFALMFALCFSLVTVSSFASAESPVAGIFEGETMSQSFSTAEEMQKWLSDTALGIVENTNLTGKRLVLLQDIEISLQTISMKGSEMASGLYIACDFDLGGHTVTITGSSNTLITSAIAMQSSSDVISDRVAITNGDIICNFTSNSSMLYGIMASTTSDTYVLDGVAFISANEQSLTNGICINGKYNGAVGFKNCVVDLNVSGSTFTNFPTGGYVYSADIESGSYKNLPNNDSKVSIKGTKLTTLPEGVDDDTTVITSDATTAMIVKGGNAYLYDTLQDAVDAVDTNDTIQLLKQPTDEKVIVSDNPQFSIKAFGEGIDTGKLPLATGDGREVVIGENGAVEVVNIPATGITLDKTSVEVFSGKTVTLTATVTPANTTDTVTWSSDDGNIATVDAYGVVTGVSQGTVTITAKAGDVSAKCTVTVDPTWTVTLDGVEHTVIKGQTFTFPSAPTKPGYIFMGWRGVDVVTYQPGDEVAITGDASFKAIWANMPDITPGTPDVPDDEPDVDVFPFYDVSAGAWYYDAVKYVWEHELMNGVSATQFSPNTTLNRAMIWTMLARLDGVNTDGGASWYAKAQEWAMAEGVSDGTDPMGAVTREQLVTMLWRFKGEPTVDFLLTAKDADTVSSWAYEAMRWAVAEGIIEGDENGMISPTATATRAQAAAIFMRFIEL
nr:S-layer homology domain-containing protein [uncultured Agathobaculum sp.]